MQDRASIIDINNFPLVNYKIVSANGTKEEIVPLGEGGSGIVYKAEQYFTETAKVNRAIKFFVYRKDLSEKFHTYISSENFQDEIVNITLFNHENIIKVIDGGIFPNENIKIPYIITDFVDGYTLEYLINNEELIKKCSLQSEKIFSLFLQIVRGIAYLHKRNFYHCDIAPKNVFIKVDDNDFYVIIGDLGVGKTLSNDIEKKYKITGTRDYMPEVATKVKDTEVNLNKFKQIQPLWDIYSLILTLKQTLEKIFPNSNIKKDYPSWLYALESILKRNNYRSVIDLQNSIEKIQPHHRITANLLELSESDSGTFKKLLPIKDALFTNRVEKIFNHPMLIRLKKVPQLLMGSEIFAGSNHTRYEHSMGTYENMRYILTQLLKKSQFIEMFDKQLLELALLSASLANITRFPFSFAIHEIKNTNPNQYKKISQKKLLEKIFTYKEGNGVFNISLEEVIKKDWYLDDLTLLKSIIGGVEDGFKQEEIQFIYSLINSSIDVRVLDFLKRDPYHLGLSNGVQFDFESLIDFLDIYNNKIAVTSRGVSSVEQVISTRYWMYKEIYWNEPNRGYTVMLKKIFCDLESNDFQDKLIDKMLFSSPKDLLIFFDEEAEKKGLTKTQDLIQNINSNRPVIFKRIFLINKSEEDSVLSGVCNKIAEMKNRELEALCSELEQELNHIFSFEKDKVNILIDIPIDRNKKLGEDINVIKYDKSIVKITDLSGIISGINNYFDSHIQWMRIYINPYYKEKYKQNKVWYDKLSECNNVIKKFLIKRLG